MDKQSIRDSYLRTILKNQPRRVDLPSAMRSVERPSASKLESVIDTDQSVIQVHAKPYELAQSPTSYESLNDNRILINHGSTLSRENR